MNNSQLVHSYAHQMQTGAKGSNLFYEGRTLYSYGHHFPICHISIGKTGEEILFWNNASYSNTTSKHQSIASRATRHITRIDIPAGNLDKIIYSSEDSEFLGLSNVWRNESQRLIKEIGTTGKAYAKRLNAYHELRQIETNILKFIRDFLGANFAKPPKNFGFFTVIREVANDYFTGTQYAADTAAREKRQEAAQQASHTRQQARYSGYRNHSVSTPEEIAEWIAGTRSSVRTGENDLLRIRINSVDTFIETSQGVIMTIGQAREIYQCLASQQLKAGDKVLTGYTVGKVNGTVQIGCHTFDTEYLLNFGKSL
jgi:hypothetical protein